MTYRIYIDPYEAEAMGIPYEYWKWVMDNQTLDPIRCEAAGIPFEVWRKLNELARIEDDGR